MFVAPTACRHFWARGYFVSTVRRDEETVREYIRSQEHEDRKYDQMGLFGNESTKEE